MISKVNSLSIIIIAMIIMMRIRIICRKVPVVRVIRGVLRVEENNRSKRLKLSQKKISSKYNKNFHNYVVNSAKYSIK